MDEKLVFTIQMAAANVQETVQKITTGCNAVGKVAQEQQRMMEGYKKALESIDGKTFKELRAEFAANEKELDKLEKAVDAAMDKLDEMRSLKMPDFSDGTSAVAEYEQALDQAGRALGNLAIRQQAVEHAMSGMRAAQAQQTQAAQEQAQTNAQTKVAFDNTAFALQSLQNIMGGSIGNIVGLANQVRFLKKSFDATRTAAGGLSGALTLGLGVVTILATVVTAATEAYKKAKEEKLAFARASLEVYRETSTEFAALERNMAVLDDQTASVEQVTAAREELARMFPEMVTGYDDEGKAILANTQALRDNYEAQKALHDFNTTMAARGLDEIKSQWDELAAKIKKANQELRAAEVYEGEYGSGFDAGQSEAYEGKLQKIEQDIAQYRTDLSKRLEETLTGAAADFEDRWNQTMPPALRAALTKLFTGEILDGDGLTYAELTANLISRFEGIFAELGANAGDPLAQSLTAAVAGVSTEPMSEEIAAKYGEAINNAVSAAESSGVTDQAKARFQELYKRIMSLDATEAEATEFDALIQKMGASVQTVAGEMDYFAGRGMSAEKIFGLVSESVLGFNISLQKNAEALRQQAIAEKAANTSHMDAAQGVSSLYKSYQDLNAEIKEVGTLKAVQAALEKGEKGSKDYANAVKYLADKYNVTEAAAADMAKELSDEIIIKEAMIEASLTLAWAQAIEQKAVVEAMTVSASFTQQAKDRIIESLEAIVSKIKETQERLGGLGGESFTIPTGSVPVLKTSKSSGGGAKQNTALQKALDDYQYLDSLDQLDFEKKKKRLEDMYNLYAKTTEEKRDIEVKLHNLVKENDNDTYQRALKQLDHRKAMGELVAETIEDETELRLAEIDAELDGLEKITAAHELTAEQREELDERMYGLRIQRIETEAQIATNAMSEMVSEMEKQSDRFSKSITDAMDEAQSKGQLTLKDQIRGQELLLQGYKQTAAGMTAAWGANMETWTDVQLKAWDAVNEKIRQTGNTVNSLYLQYYDQLVSALDTALKNKASQEQEAAQASKELAVKTAQDAGKTAEIALKKANDAAVEGMKARHQLELENINAERDARLAAITDEIKALDDLLKAKENGDKDAEELRAIGTIQAQIAYENDDYNKAALQRQLEELQKSRDDRLFKLDIENKKEALREEQTLLKQESADALSELKDRQSAELDALKTQNSAELELLKERNTAELEQLRALNVAKLDEMALYRQKEAVIQNAIMAGNLDAITKTIDRYNPMFNTSGVNLAAILAAGFSDTLVTDVPAGATDALNTLSPGSEVGALAVQQGAALGEASGKALGSGIETWIGHAIENISANFNKMLSDAEARVDAIVARAKSVTGSGGSSASATQQKSRSASDSASTTVIFGDTNITMPPGSTDYEIFQEDAHMKHTLAQAIIRG